MKQKRVKLSDIAKELNVSVALVSFVMSGKWKENRVSEELAGKVLKTAEEMGYRPNSAARALRTGRSGVIGLVVADISNPFFAEMAREIENEASKLGMQVMYASSDEDSSKLQNKVDVLIARQVDGLIVVPVIGSEEYLIEKSKQGVPIVLIDRFISGSDLPYVVDDGVYGGSQLTKLLIGNGYSDVCAITYKSCLSNFTDRVEGFENAIGKIKIPSIINVPQQDYYSILEEKLLDAINEGVKAFFFLNNKIGIAAIKILRGHNIRIPEDIAIVSYDDPDVFELMTPSVTGYKQDVVSMSKMAVSVLMDNLSKENISKGIKVKGKVMGRESGKGSVK